MAPEAEGREMTSPAEILFIQGMFMGIVINIAIGFGIRRAQGKNSKQ